jgi:hypothetical protein
MKYWLLGLLLALPLVAQNQGEDTKKPAEPPEPQEHKLFILKYADPNRLQNLLGILGANASASESLHAVAVSARARDMPAIEDAIKRLDVPTPTPPDVELTAYLITGSDAPATGSGGLPKELDPVMTQLKNAFPFKSYHLMDTLSLRTRSGDGGNTKSILQPEGSQVPVYDELNIGSATVNPDESGVRVDKLRASIRMNIGTPPNTQFGDLGLNADVDVKEGQKVVVGRLSMGHDQALFLVLTAHVVP